MFVTLRTRIASAAVRSVNPYHVAIPALAVQTIAESLRLYPQPPVLIRRAEQDMTLPQGTSAFPDGFELKKGCDIFISTWNLHRSPHLWENANEFEPERFERRFTNDEVKGWTGYNPAAQGSSMYPNEVRASDRHACGCRWLPVPRLLCRAD